MTALNLSPLRSRLAVLLLLSGSLTGAPSPGAEPRPAKEWRFAVSGDSRDCGDIVMPGIAAGVLRERAEFYWHLGDFRAIYDFDQDFQHLVWRNGKQLTILTYEEQAWDDFIANQLEPFGRLPVYLGIGNHDVIQPKTRGLFLAQFADWLDTPVLRAQRLKDNPADHRLKTWYHWVQDGVDFINLDNATTDQFESEQLKWFEGVLARDAADDGIRTVVVGMHATLPHSIAKDHSMSVAPASEQSGRRVYEDLLNLRKKAHKNVYLLASHSHFYMDDAYNTAFWRENGGVLPGWVIGTAGAIRYPLPENWREAKAAATNVYGYLLATVNPHGQPPGTITFEFRLLKEQDIPAGVADKFSQHLVHECFVGNSAKQQPHPPGEPAHD